ncbi:putative bifunctional diguanylate cyclase/phosphodiesterase [Mycobacterium sp. 29Ha]|uniref:putative bifunctional diguanylate cyclase/phosphodiesterase n=1 Tax=Mycobacterium sp. 29Ha TaxID=2939268 RepID=UPI00293929CE|nr:EAL domain-containing protein [Mycobacterium sp. 29Ha]MDV3135284.1 EAL domain-containing protein [Mycobacterium sp. 29Ha]
MNRVSVTNGQLRLGLFAGVLVLLCVNALALWGEATARQVHFALLVIAGIAVVVTGVAVARRVTGIARAWRLLGVATIVCNLVGDVIWWSNGATPTGTAPWPAVAAYFLSALLALGALALLAFAGVGQTAWRSDPVRTTRIVTVIDGLVAALAFAILAVAAGVGASTGASLPRSGNTVAVIVYAAIQLVVVAAAVLIATWYRRDRPYRANFLLLAAGTVMLVSSDRLVAYLRTVGFERGDLWVGIGFVLGLLLIAYGMLELTPPRPIEVNRDALDWLRLLLPYVGFLGTATLFAFHVLIGQRLNVFLVCGAVVMVALVATRQLIETRAQWLLIRRLYDAQRRLAHQLYHDALTGLPNRLLFTERLDDAMRDGRFMLIFVDLDDFKEVNDRFGHAAGDELLRAIGERLKRCVRDNDTLARIGGDEFAILIDGESEQLEDAAERLRVALRDPFALHGSAVRVKASMGLVRPGADGVPQTSDDLLRQADISMYAGKRLGKDTAVVYQPSSGSTIDFPTALRNADGEAPPGFRLVYQVVVQLPEGNPVAVEALARWTTPTGIEISPETFVAAAEAAGLAADLDALVLDTACRDVQQAGLDLDIHVNIGAGRLGNPTFEQQVRLALTRHHLPPNRLVVEITETLPIVDLAQAAAQIKRLNALGVKVALDDFGAGFNSLMYMHALPVQIVKLDRGLATADQARDLTLYRSVIGLCDELGLTVIVEGIESAAQSDAVYRAGGRLAQGHLYGYPVPISELSVTPARVGRV